MSRQNLFVMSGPYQKIMWPEKQIFSRIQLTNMIIKPAGFAIISKFFFYGKNS